ncbi:hypothetical protein Tco_0887188 [Tanacetum coccineum]
MVIQLDTTYEGTWIRRVDQDEDPSVGLNQGKKNKKRRVTKSESSKKTSTTKESSKGKSLARTSKSGKSVTTKESVEELVFEKLHMKLSKPFKGIRLVILSTPYTNVDETQANAALKIPKKDWFKKALSYVKLEYNIEECYHALTKQLDWANAKGHKSPVDMSKPLPLQDKEGRLVIPVEFFFNNDLECLKAGNKERMYSSSITKTPAARYTMEGIEDMILTQCSPVIITYDKDAALGISHGGPQCQ